MSKEQLVKSVWKQMHKNGFSRSEMSQIQISEINTETGAFTYKGVTMQLPPSRIPDLKAQIERRKEQVAKARAEREEMFHLEREVEAAVAKDKAAARARLQAYFNEMKKRHGE